MPNEPSGIVVNYYLKKEKSDDVVVLIFDPLGKEIRSIKGSSQAGFHKLVWDMRAASSGNQAGQTRFRRSPMVSPGEYMVVLEIGEIRLTKIARIRQMPENGVLMI